VATVVRVNEYEGVRDEFGKTISKHLADVHASIARALDDHAANNDVEARGNLTIALSALAGVVTVQNEAMTVLWARMAALENLTSELVDQLHHD
jgi:frataxin-like iron-binding protein CyaY